MLVCLGLFALPSTLMHCMAFIAALWELMSNHMQRAALLASFSHAGTGAAAHGRRSMGCACTAHRQRRDVALSAAGWQQ